VQAPITLSMTMAGVNWRWENHNHDESKAGRILARIITINILFGIINGKSFVK